MKRLQGRVAVITGAASGIGQATAVRLAEEGAALAPTDVLDVSETVSLCEAAGAQASGLYLDVASKDDTQNAVDSIIQKWGRIDIWVNCAGVFNRIPTVDLSEEEWDRSVDINYKSIYLSARQYIPYMVKQGWGRVISISSMAAKMAYPREISYMSTKAAVLGATRSLAIDLGPHGATANAICPGPIDTAMLAKTHQELADDFGMTKDQWDRQVIETIPVGRFGKPQEVAALIAFLASDEAAFINGQSINIDGGMVFY